MKRKFLNISFPETTIAIVVEFVDTDQVFWAGKLKASSSQVLVKKEFIKFDSIEAIIKKFGLNLSYTISFIGKGILTKCVKKDSFSFETLLHNQNPNSFFFEKIETEENVLISFCRKESIMSFLDAFKEKKCMLIKVSIGYLSLNFLDELHNGTYRLYGKQLKFSDTGLASIGAINEESNYRSIPTQIELNKQFAPALGLLRSYVLNSETIERTELDWVQKNAKVENKQRRLFHGLGASILVLFLVALIGNYFYLESLNGSIVKKNEELSKYRMEIEALSDLKRERKRKQQVLKHSGLMDENYLSFYTQELVIMMPEELLLRELKIHPVDKVKQKSKLSIEERKVLISGEAKNSKYVQLWIDRIKSMEWVLKVELLGYELENLDSGIFEIEIVLNA